MNLQRRFLTITVMLLVICMMFGQAAVFAETKTLDNSDVERMADEEENGFETISATLEILREEYIEDVNPYELMEGAVNGIKTYLKLKQAKSEDLDGFIDKERTLEANMRKLGDLYGEILIKNKGKVDDDDLLDYALKGMMKVVQEKYKDPYTVALDKKEYKILKEHLNSEGFSGIGVYIEVDKDKNALVIVDPIEGSPAEKAGLKSGDLILRINGYSTKGMDLVQASNRIRGKIKTPVKLHMGRGNREFDVTVLRDTIIVKSIKYRMIGDVGYIKLSFFGETTDEEFEEAITDLEKQGAKALVLDLRNNGGGYVTAAVQVCSRFIKDGEVVTSVVNYRKGSRVVHKAMGNLYHPMPLAVLVNKYSASASEITAGCIKDTETGVIVGEKSFGKGSVQTIQSIRGGGAIKYTTAHYLTPAGKDINKKGIKPDVEISLDSTKVGSKNDPQLDAAVRYLLKKIAVK